MLSHRFFFILLLGVVLLGRPLLTAQETDPDELKKVTDDVLEKVVEIRGLDFKSPVKNSIRDSIEIAGYMKDLMRKESEWFNLDQEGRMLHVMGLIPGDIDYRENFLKLLAEPVESRYDEYKDTLYIASWLPAQEQRSVLAHELTRALQDQWFDIANILEVDRSEKDHDRILAHRALLEGDRTVVMLQMALEPENRHFSELPNLAYVMQSWMETTQVQEGASGEAPAYLKQTLLFPYGYGASFLQEVWKNKPGWGSVNAIYSDLPVSTEQILHPEKYFGVRDNPKPVKYLDPIARLGDPWHVAYENVLGEFSLGLLLSLHATEEYSRKATSGWGGDVVMRLENDEGLNAVFVNTIWDTEEDAENFFLAMDSWFQKRFPEDKKKDETENGFWLLHEGQFYSIKREGTGLHFILGLPEEDGRKWLGK